MSASARGGIPGTPPLWATVSLRDLVSPTSMIHARDEDEEAEEVKAMASAMLSQVSAGGASG